MLGKLLLTAGVWACLVGAGQAAEEGPPPPEKKWFPPAFATRPRVTRPPRTPAPGAAVRQWTTALAGAASWVG